MRIRRGVICQKTAPLLLLGVPVSEIKPNVSPARQILDYDDIIASLGNYGVFCVDIGLMRIIRKLIAERGMYRTTYSLGPTADGYIIPTWEQMVPINNAIGEFLGSDDMSCDIVAGLAGIENAIRDLTLQTAANCAEGAGGAGLTAGPANGFESDGTNFPSGFADKTAFDSFKCNMAAFILKNIEIDIQTLVNLEVTEITIAGLLVSFVTPTPVDDIAMLVVNLVTIVGEAYIDAVLSEIQESIDDNQDALRCLLYNSLSATDAKNSIVDWIIDNVSELASGVFKLFVGIDNMNRLFENTAIPVSLSADCSMCAPEEVRVILGLSSYTGLGTYQGINSINDNSFAWGNLTFNPGATLTFSTLIDPSGNEGKTFTAVIIWSESREGGVSSIYADGVQVSSGGTFTVGEVGGSYETRFDIDPIVADVFVINLNMAKTDAAVYEVQFMTI